MTAASDLEIFLVTHPGMESTLADEARSLDFRNARTIMGGVTVDGGWPDVWRANLELRGATRVLVRIGSFRVMHLAQLDKRARKFPWADTLRKDVPVRVEAACKNSKIYHAGAAAQRIETAIREELGAPISPDAELCIKARIEDNLCTISIDTSGELSHRRGHKEAIGKAPMRETLASLFLRKSGFGGTEPVYDPMCGSGTFVIEAAEIAAALKPGRARSFAFEQLATFDATAWAQMNVSNRGNVPAFTFHGSDRDAGAIRMSRANAERAGVGAITSFRQRAVNDIEPPDGPPGLVVVNPPYGTRIGEKKQLYGLYGALGKSLMNRFHDWRVAMVTTDASLAKASGLPFGPPSPAVAHGGLRAHLFQTNELNIE